MKIVVTFIAVAAAICGWIGAYLWYRASVVDIDPGYIRPGGKLGETYRRNGIDFPRGPESGDPEMQRINEIAATWEAMTVASQLNKVAARWTAASVTLGAVSGIMGIWLLSN